VIFEDLECPDCARRCPARGRAARTYKIPWCARLPAPDASLGIRCCRAGALLRYAFEGSRQRVPRYRLQASTEITKDRLRSFAEKLLPRTRLICRLWLTRTGNSQLLLKRSATWAATRAAAHTHLYVVSNKRSGTPFVEVVDRSQLFQLIDTMKKGVAAKNLDKVRLSVAFSPARQRT